jgi:hypothetical protein
MRVCNFFYLLRIAYSMIATSRLKAGEQRTCETVLTCNTIQTCPTRYCCNESTSVTSFQKIITHNSRTRNHLPLFTHPYRGQERTKGVRSPYKCHLSIYYHFVLKVSLSSPSFDLDSEEMTLFCCVHMQQSPLHTLRQNKRACAVAMQSLFMLLVRSAPTFAISQKKLHLSAHKLKPKRAQY